MSFHGIQQRLMRRHRSARSLVRSLSLSLSLSATAAESGPPSRETDLETTVRAFVEEHCFACHGETKPKADLTLRGVGSDFTDLAVADVWQAVHEKLELGEMPPKKRPQPEAEAVKRVTRWIERELGKVGRKPSLEHKRRSAQFGNHIDHETLFDGSRKGPAFSRPRLWRLSPYVYDRVVDGLGEGVRHAAAIHQPFAIDDGKGVINDFASRHFADAATLQLLLMNCRTVARYQTTGILRREHDGRMHRHRRTPRVVREILDSDVPPNSEQLRAVIEHEYRLLLERSPTEAEMSRTLDLATRAIGKAGKVLGLQTALMAILLKPEAVYRLEIGLGPRDEHGRRRLSPYELAFALAYSLVDEGPGDIRVRLGDVGDDGGDDHDDDDDDEPAAKSLLEIAHEGGLSTPQDIRRVVRRILDDNDMSVADYTMFAEDHKVRNSRVLRFFREFFGYHHAPRVFKDAKRIGIDSGFETRRMVNDADQLVMHIFDEDRDVLRRLLTTDEYFVAYPGSLEKFRKELRYIRNNVDDANFERNSKYIARAEAAGRTPIPIEGPSSRSYVGFYNIDHETWNYPREQPFQMPRGQRAGILTHPAWLVAWSGNFDNDPIRRGKWIREHLLADTVPDLPITVDAVVPEDPHRTLRQRLEATREEFCWRCHRKMNPLGLPFERFDDFGRFRSEAVLGEVLTIFPGRHRDSRTVPVDTSGEIIDSGEKGLDGKVRTVFELVHQLAGSTRVRQSFVRHAFRYWMGRNETLDDSPTLIAADSAYTQGGGSMKALIASLLSSDSFLYRR